MSTSSRPVIARGGDETTLAEAEVEAPLNGASRLADQVPAGDSDIGDAVGDELRDVLGADEQRLELAAQQCGKSAVAPGEHRQSGVSEELAGVIGESSFIWQRDLEHGGRREAGSGKREAP